MSHCLFFFFTCNTYFLLDLRRLTGRDSPQLMIEEAGLACLSSQQQAVPEKRFQKQACQKVLSSVHRSLSLNFLFISRLGKQPFSNTGPKTSNTVFEVIIPGLKRKRVFEIHQHGIKGLSVFISKLWRSLIKSLTTANCFEEVLSSGQGDERGWRWCHFFLENGAGKQAMTERWMVPYPPTIFLTAVRQGRSR